MHRKSYNNFVKAKVAPETRDKDTTHSSLNGEEARKLYIAEVKEIKDPVPASDEDCPAVKAKTSYPIHNLDRTQLRDKDLFLAAQNSDVDTLRLILDSSSDKINIVDDYGWSLLMIACQANSVETVMELLKRGINTSVRDKAGNSAQNLVIRNRNYVLADLLLSNKPLKTEYRSKPKTKHNKHGKDKTKEQYECDICKDIFPDKFKHLSSTIHNINTSKLRSPISKNEIKTPANYVIPESNRGYQIMLKVGWDKESGLGPDGSGKKYPIKTVQKKDRKGLGHEKKQETKSKTETDKKLNQKILQRDNQNRTKMEINFRREFY